MCHVVFAYFMPLTESFGAVPCWILWLNNTEPPHLPKHPPLCSRESFTWPPYLFPWHLQSPPKTKPPAVLSLHLFSCKKWDLCLCREHASPFPPQAQLKKSMGQLAPGKRILWLGRDTLLGSPCCVVLLQDPRTIGDIRYTVLSELQCLVTMEQLKQLLNILYNRTNGSRC